MATTGVPDATGPVRSSAVSIRAVIWDFGGVLSTSPFEAFARYEAEQGLPDGFIRGLNATDPDTNAWARLERAELDLAGFAEAFEAEARAAGGELDGHEVLGLLAGDLRPAMIDAVRRCRERLPTALITNNVAGLRAGHGPGPLLDELFDVVLESSAEGLRKPDPRIYQRCCERLGVEPPACAFLDDLGVNLKPARALGMTTIKVIDPDAALDELEQVLGFPLR
jgi:putative hydrolase of the HAD superfamily